MTHEELLRRQCPWCMIGLAVVCMGCNLMVLLGNWATASAIEAIGRSTKGWSNVGLDLAFAFKNEIDMALTNMTAEMISSIGQIETVVGLVDSAIAAVGGATEQSLSIGGLRDVALMDDEYTAHAERVADVVHRQLPSVTEGLDLLMDYLEPVLLQVGDWETRFGDKLQSVMEQFSTTVDLVQDMMNNIMSQIGAGGGAVATMEQNTYSLLAVSNKSRGISVADLKDVAAIYSITALQGSKAEDLFLKYDVNQDAAIDQNEYSDFVDDPTLPGMMAVVLRSYAKRLDEVSGLIGRAIMRDEVANALVRYLQLVCAKNLTKVGWIAQRLTNGTLPLAFTGAVMKNLALLADDPAVLSTTDIGETVISAMTTLDPNYTMLAVDLLSNATWWDAEAFDPADQPVVVSRVAHWVGAVLHQNNSTVALLRFYRMGGGLGDFALRLPLGSVLGGSTDERASDDVALAWRHLTEQNQKTFFELRNHEYRERHQQLMRASASRYLFNSLLGGQTASRGPPSGAPKGQFAVPATLQFAKWLSWNETMNAKEKATLCFVYSGMANTPGEAIAPQIQGMVKKIQALITLLGQYSGPEGVGRLREKIDEFANSVQEEFIGALLAKSPTRPSLYQLQVSERGVHAQDPQSSGSTADIVSMLQQIQGILPQVLANMKITRAVVSSVTSAVHGIFIVFNEKAPAFFYKMAKYYRLIWIAWFLVISFFTFGIMYYGFWASGFCGGPKAEEAIEDYEPPGTFSDRLRCLACCCCALPRYLTWCCGGPCCSRKCVFWSLLILGQVFTLVVFLIAVVLCLLAGINLFVATGCASVYVLGDEASCTETLLMVQQWLSTFTGGSPEYNIHEVCKQNNLPTCAILSGKLKLSGVTTVVFGVLAAIFSFQLLIESAVMFERAQNRRVLDGVLKDLNKETESEEKSG